MKTLIIRTTARLLVTTFALCLLVNQTQAADTDTPKDQTDWEATVNDLLATGMYGPQGNILDKMHLQLQNKQVDLPGLPHGQSLLDTRSITFSYEGSSGLLKFSAGYLLSKDPLINTPASVILDVEPLGEHVHMFPERSWYFALDLSRSYQLDENFSLSLGNKAFLFTPPFDSRDGKTLSLLFSMPITYKNYMTITPELQWTRPLSPYRAGFSSGSSSSSTTLQADNIFYGGVSISFSY